MFSRCITRMLIRNVVRRSLTSQSRNNNRQEYRWSKTKWNFIGGKSRSVAALALSSGFAFVLHASTSSSEKNSEKGSKVDYNKVRKSIADLLDDSDYDDGSFGPLFIRLGWHASGTFSKLDGTGGSNGGCIRFKPESDWDANKGLHVARERLENIYRSNPGLTYADLYTLAAVVAIEEMGGPKINWRPGRQDFNDGKKSPPDGRLPDAAQGAQHIRDIFYRMGFNDQEIVALIGAHSLGRCHKDRSGFDGPWTFAPTTFSNEFFRLLLEEKWQIRRWNGPKQYEDVKTKTLMMLPSDIALIEDPQFRKYVVQYANDGDKFTKDFSTAFEKLLELGVDFKSNQQGKSSSLWSRIFG